MSQSDYRAPSHDARWGNHVPWSLRFSEVAQKGDFHKFMQMLGTRLNRLFEHLEARLNAPHFFARLYTESLGHFQYKSADGSGMYHYFALATIQEEAKARVANDPEEGHYHRMLHVDPDRVAKEVAATRPVRYADHCRGIIAERLDVLESIFVLLQQDKKHEVLKSLVRDVRRFAADSGIFLDVKGDPPTLVSIEEPLLQREVLDRLLPRLELKFPLRAADLTKAYHDLLKGVDTNTVFGNAFKALEELAREISNDAKLELSDRTVLEKSFPKLHGTIRDTVIKLAAHRGDEGAHGRKGPDEYEIRYLLFCICNVALVLLEYKEHCSLTVAELSCPIGVDR